VAIQNEITKLAGRQMLRGMRRSVHGAEKTYAGHAGKDVLKLGSDALKASKVKAVLAGINVDDAGFKKLLASVRDDVEIGRIGSISEFVRKRPWMNPDLVTVEGFRAALPTGRNPAAVELERAVAKVDFRFRRDYKLAADWVDDAHNWEFVSHNALAGDEGASYWLRSPAGEYYMAKVPPEARRAVNERAGYVIHTQLGVPVNQVQYAQRDYKPLMSLHKRIEGEPVSLNRVADDIGLDATDFRVGSWPYPANNIGTGPSTWNRPDATAYQAKISRRLEDPSIFDKLAFVGRINDDGDLKPGNILATVIRENADGQPVYRITRIDFGIMHDGYQMRNLQGDLMIFGDYLKSLEAAENATHLKNVLPTMKQFASLSDDNLTKDVLGNILRNSDDSPALHMPGEFQWQMSRRFVIKRDMVRDWLARNAERLASLL